MITHGVKNETWGMLWSMLLINIYSDYPFFSVSWNFCLFHVYRESKSKSSPVEKVSDKDVLQEFCCKIKMYHKSFAAR